MVITITKDEKGLNLQVEGEVSRVELVGVLELVKNLVVNDNSQEKEEQDEV